MVRRLYLCGASNAEGVRLALRVNQATGRWDEILLLDDDPARLGRQVLGIRVAGPFGLLAEVPAASSETVNLVARTTTGRRNADLRIASFGIRSTGLISPDVDLLGAEIAPDLIAYQNATIGPEVRISEGCVVFMGAAVGHECRIGRHCVIAANSVLNARVHLGDGVYVGSGAVLLPEIEIGAGATIGAGAVVIADVPPGATVVGPLGVTVGAASEPPRASAGEDPAGALSAIWCEVLGVGRVEPDQNFFDLGGDSLLALRVLQRIKARLGATLSPVDLYQYPTVSALATHLRGAGTSGPELDQIRRRAESRRRVQSGR